MTTNVEKEEKENVSKDKVPHGYVYKVTNIQNDKTYIGKAKEGRSGSGKTAIEKRWNAQIERATRFQRWNNEHPLEKKRLRYIENAIIKYGEHSFRLQELDVAFSKDELNEKEQYWIQKFESRNHSKGYNLSDGGEGGGHHERTIVLLSKISQEKAKNPEHLKKLSIAATNLWKDEKYQEKVRMGIQKKYQEKEYREKQIAERRERAKDPEWIEKMTTINKTRAQDPNWIKKVSNIGLKKWQQKEHIERQLRVSERKRKKIKNVEIFLKDIQGMQKKDLDAKYGFECKTTNRHIQHLLGHRGVSNYTEAREFLIGKKLADVLRDIEDNKEKQIEDKIKRRERLQDTKQFLRDIQEMEKKDIDFKYGITSKTTNYHIRRILGHLGIENYTQAREYLKEEKKD